MLVKLIGVFLGLYLSGVSATPTGLSPNTALVPRTAIRNMCSTGDRWVLRECAPEAGPTAWADVCRSHSTGPEYKRGDKCSNNAYCENVFDGENYTIKCVDRQPPGTSAATKSATDPQIGCSANLRAWPIRQLPELEFTVKVLNPMKASVSAFLISEDQSFVVTPRDNNLVGKIRGRGTIVCAGDRFKSDASRAKVCYPTGKYQLLKGDQIDFTWGMTIGQVASLAYTIWPSS